MTKLTVIARMLPDGVAFTVKGREAWAFLELVKAGPKGCTPIDNPGPRWSAYVFTLKRDYGLAVETRHEPHRGPFPGNHARYLLHDTVEVISRSDEMVSVAA